MKTSFGSKFSTRSLNLPSASSHTRPQAPARASTLPPSASSHTRPQAPARASTLPPSAPSPLSTKPTAAAPGATNTPAAPQATTPLKHPGMPEGAPSYSPYSQSHGQSDNLMISGGDNKLTAPPTAKQNMYVDRPGNPYQKDVFGGTVNANTGSMQASTTHQTGGGVFHHSAEASINGPQASYQTQGTHAGRFGISSAQLTAEANAFRASGQAGISADRNSHAYTAALTGKAETGVGVTGSVSHDFNRHAGGYLKGEAKAGAGAYAEAVASLDPRTATAMLSAQAGASATAGVYGTAGGHLGRLHGSVTGGAVAGVAAQAGGKLGLENGFLKHSADVNAAMGVGTHFKTDAALDVRHHIKPGIAEGLRPGIASAAGVGAPGAALAPEQSGFEKFFTKLGW
ncbi:hypothetical protein SAMN05444354_1312 [Stigmatella aurantiaca]|uniref:Uncharacterized protein n=1 Tax=Stigmatella aurantiaca TaxID=41 RepID=A0A1H8DUE7_STIAU|nr:hypothetical protein [Stigmatella aurantiaca]SEN10840.1 hypothetical protein SAMN05444354_1312 [Stigmatella aurantiaca]